MKRQIMYSSSVDLRYLTQIEKIEKLRHKVMVETYHHKKGHGYNKWQAEKNLKEAICERIKLEFNETVYKNKLRKVS